MTSDFDKAVDEMQASIIEDARKIYSEKVIELWLNPKNIGIIDNYQSAGKITGPCGDTMQIFLKINNDKIIDAHFITDGCATSVAAGSMATELARGKTIQDAFKISQQLILDALDGLPEDSVHCALLASNTLKKALRDYLVCKKDPWKRVYKKDI